MKQIPGFVMRHEVEVEPFLGTNAAGEVYGVKTKVKCHFVEQTKMVRNAQGEEVSSTASYVAVPTHRPPENSRVTASSGRTPGKVVAIVVNTWPGMSVPANTQVFLD